MKNILFSFFSYRARAAPGGGIAEPSCFRGDAAWRAHHIARAHRCRAAGVMSGVTPWRKAGIRYETSRAPSHRRNRFDGGVANGKRQAGGEMA